jgi:FkbM family methyltransferase
VLKDARHDNADRLAGALGRAALRLAPWHGRGWAGAGWRGRAHRSAGSIVARVVAWYAWAQGPRSVGLVQLCERAFPQWFPRDGWRECRGLWHGYRLRLDCSDYFQRLAWVLRRYHDGPLQVLIGRALRAGDVFVDGGANHGLVSMYAAWRVGSGGRVHAFEPGLVRQQLDWHVRENGLVQVVVHPVGLSDRDEKLRFRVPDPQNLGAGTLAPLPARYGAGARDEGEVRTVRGDDEVATPAGGQAVVKLDVEGFEVRALEGLRALIETARPLVITEVNQEMLGMAGSSALELWEWLTGRGYRAFEYSTRRAVLRQTRLVLRRLGVPGENGAAIPTDLAWLRPQSEAWRRLERWIEV